jgi:hypothetical protein
VAEESSPELLHRAAPPRRARHRLRHVLANRAALDEFFASRASSWCDPRAKPSPQARSRDAPVSPPTSTAARRRPCARVRPEPPDQVVMVLIDLTATACATAVVGCLIEIQRAGLDLTRVNTGQTGMTSSFCRNPPKLFRFTKVPFCSSKFLYS